MNRATAIIVGFALFAVACGDSRPPNNEAGATGANQTSVPPGDAAAAGDAFRVEAERFADLRVLRYQAPGFADLDLAAKKLLYYH
jgi:dipeptidyl-peptidase-3